MKKNQSSLFVFIVLFLLISFACRKELPPDGASAAIVSISTASNITPVSAIVSAVVISDEGAKVTSRGFCWGTSPSPNFADHRSSDSIGIGDFTRKITGLIPGTTYYLRAYAKNIVGTTYGEEITFQTIPPPKFNTTLTYGTMTDIDGNIYKTIRIGTQTWMAENLKTKRFRNGDPVPLVTDNDQWKALTSAACCNYNNDEDGSVVYGRLYNGYAVSDSRNLSPQGWHIPSITEWSTLLNNLGGSSAAVNKLKEQGTYHWSDGAGNNESGFTALPGGFRDGDFAGLFFYKTTNGYFWSNTMVYRSLGSYGPKIDPRHGMSVRCVKD